MIISAKFQAILVKLFITLMQTTAPEVSEVICIPHDPMGICFAEVDVAAETTQCVTWRRSGESVTVCHTQ